eukprot:m51a1_g11401 putative purine nucleoside phosphorylase (282) ;mRNA; r:28907-30629
MADNWDRSLAAAEYIRKQCKPGQKFEVGIVLGSGLGALAEQVVDRTVIKYSDIRTVVPSFPLSTVAGHAGNFVVGDLGGKPVIVQQGRWHFYEGYEISDVVLGIRILFHLGVKKLIITNAAGGVNTSFKAGDLMLITDHINMLGANPLFGHNDDRFGVRFPDMSHAYTPRLLDIARATARELGHESHVREGVYAAMRGPNYETPAEIRMLRALGADAVGMSTVPEVIVASHQRMEVVGISCITNMAAGVLDQPLSHEEVKQTADAAAPVFTSLLTALAARI